MKNPLLIIATVFLTSLSFSQTKVDSASDLKIGVIEKINSVELNENRILNIYLPEGYAADGTAAYPVIYLLDGSISEDFIHIVGVVQFLTMIEKMPTSIVVGIANVDRRRDFTFPTTIEQDKKDYPTTGSSAKFMAFIEKELQPFIQKKYKVNGNRTIIGQSLGGLLATEILLKKPNLFENYVIVSPSLWWDHESLFQLLPSLVKKPLTAHIFVSIGSEGKQSEADSRKLVEALQKRSDSPSNITFAPLPQETHLTILHNSVYKALEFLNKK